jgi:hypothetical protein
LTEATKHLKERQNKKCKKKTLGNEEWEMGADRFGEEDLAMWEKLGLDLPHCMVGGLG